MRLLLDTHVIIWALTADKRLTKDVIDMILDPNNEVYFSSVSLLEIAIKNYKNPKLCPYKEEEIYKECIASNYLELPLKKEHVFGIKNLKPKIDHNLIIYDPFDRALLSIAKSEGCKFITGDSNFLNYDEPFILKI